MEIASNLVGNLPEDLLSELKRIIVKLSKRNKLDNIPGHLLAPGTHQWILVRIKDVHFAEILASNPNNDDAHGKTACLDYLVYGLLHIIYLSVGKDNQNTIVILILLLSIEGVLNTFIYQWGK